jgi:hypothetical protein
MKNLSDPFLQLFSHPTPALRVKFRPTDDHEQARQIRVQHRLGPAADAASQDYLDSLGPFPQLEEFRKFYQTHDGAELCRTHDARYGQERPLLEFKPARSITSFTSRYAPGGDLAWTIDLNKSKALYRNSAPWIAFAEIHNGPACLTLFLDGENAGFVYYATPQPAFNILRPIARGFQPLLQRIARDLPAFLRLVRATVTLRGKDGDNYGFMPVEYRARAEERT